MISLIFVNAWKEAFCSNMILGKFQQCDYVNTYRNGVSGMYQMIHSERFSNSIIRATGDTWDIILQSPSLEEPVSCLWSLRSTDQVQYGQCHSSDLNRLSKQGLHFYCL